jgi:hypothetical protein
MPAVGIAQATGLIVVFGEKERSVGVLGSVFEETPIDALHELRGFVESHGALAAKIRLKIRHQQSRADPLTGDIADY